MEAPSPASCRTILLRHTLPDGTFHYDWMLDPGGGRGLITFRVGARIDEITPAPSALAGTRPSTAAHAFDAECIADHRRDYLEYEGPISGGRGTVERIARGACTVERESEAELVVTLDWGKGALRLVGTPEVSTGRESNPAAPRRWRFRLA